ncbi:hypothetical protein BVF91_07415 [Thermoanaerobacterium sp. PSU-2]|uniref:CRISPR-associated helicase/endonuclease Cas3 n=1 Tax=Thermoanaerobacterium sp. PSU-2 TaxID=1930849 RepID=UPI000A155F85|nr:CRISPR-associated helicase/endonuclease Cas3 [Thermoanaerobacterium sp. PSU-2]ORX23346.1 hypothetical protein BVF91_07415 [Thermoanaerobacterium sp. PSU-2]
MFTSIPQSSSTLVNYSCLNDVLAKDDGETLIEHTKKVVKVLIELKNLFKNAGSYFGDDLLFEKVYIAGLFHDLGKIMPGFQIAIQNKSHWDFRHEFASLFLIGDIYINGKKLDENEIIDIYTIIVTHHKSLKDLKEKWIGYIEKSFIEVTKGKIEKGIVELAKLLEIDRLSARRIYHDIFLEYVDYVKKTYNTLTGNTLDLDIIKNYSESRFFQRFDRIYDIVQDSKRKQKLIFMIGLMKSADHLASSGQIEIIKISTDFKIFEKGIRLYSTQERASKIKDDVLLIAPTGSGKTEAALSWAKNNMKNSDNDRIFYLLPNIASINKMVERLQNIFGKDKVVPVHSKTAFKIYENFIEEKTFEELSEEEKHKINKNVSQQKSLIKKIHFPVKVATIYQLLKNAYYIGDYEINFAELYNARVIVDEIHAYEKEAVCKLIIFLKFLKENFNTKIMIMSATIPTNLQEFIIKKLDIENVLKMKDEELVSFNRHIVFRLPGTLMNYVDEIAYKVRNRKKILVVANTVETGQDLYKILKDKLSGSYIKEEDIKLLHSHFTLKDRDKIEEKVGDYKLLVATQVVEVSLNISYNELYTEPAPLDALLQRFGRINRFREKSELAAVFIVEKDINKKGYPYRDRKVVEKTLELFKKSPVKLEEKAIQKMLDEVYSSYDYEVFVDPRLYNYLNESLTEKYDNKDLKKQFYEEFDGITVYPFAFKDKVVELINNKDFYELELYKISLNLGTVLGLMKKRLIEQERINGIPINFVKCYYDSEIGLDKNRPLEIKK